VNLDLDNLAMRLRFASQRGNREKKYQTKAAT
jgi:hypothetical protein